MFMYLELPNDTVLRGGEKSVDFFFHSTDWENLCLPEL